PGDAGTITAKTRKTSMNIDAASGRSILKALSRRSTGQTAVPQISADENTSAKSSFGFDVSLIPEMNEPNTGMTLPETFAGNGFNIFEVNESVVAVLLLRKTRKIMTVTYKANVT